LRHQDSVLNHKAFPESSTPVHAARAVEHILRACGHLGERETVAIIFDSGTRALAPLFAEQAKHAARVLTAEVPLAGMHGQEPPAHAAALMLEADLVVGLTTMSMAHTRARQEASQRGARYLSLPEYSMGLLADPSVTVDYVKVEPVVRRITDAFTNGSAVRVTTAMGTDISLDIRGRIGNCCPGFVREPGSLGSPPDIESNVSPVETASKGTVVVDGSIPCPDVGLLRTPVVLTVEGGRIVRFDSEDRGVVATLERLFAGVGSDKAYVLAECGVGLNEKAKLTGIMLTDEGAAGCMHFGFGSNATVGGLNSVPFHLDFVFRDATLEVDGKCLIESGSVLP
jgi:2,5-dihydroxypyridine 5,6-dioxygenase